MSNSGNILVRQSITQLSEKLPPGWRVSTSAPGRLRLRGPGSQSASIVVEPKTRLDPKEVDYLAAVHPATSTARLIVSPFLSPRTRERLKSGGFNFLDMAGNARIVLATPGLFVETHGAERNPQASQRDRRSLKGAKAGRLIRALTDYIPPFGLRELAKRTGLDPGYASRIVDYLDGEALLTREVRGPITGVDWPALLRRWSQESSPFKRGRVQWFLAARGVAAVVSKLRTTAERYAVTGSWAAAQLAPIAPPQLLLVYAEDVASAAASLDLLPTDSGANVALVAPLDPVVFDRCQEHKGIRIVAPSQIAVDLLTSPGRGPNEAEALIEWMRENEHVWRS
ncbi:MAG: hypothetical protein HY820_39210 [Acidobacteria bacterium]|nr:hypothetical protein [Acidobacteriota bacterium]